MSPMTGKLKEMTRGRGVWVAVAMALMIAGCQTMGSPRGRLLLEEARLPLTMGQSYPASWATRDLSVDYHMSSTGGPLNVTGRVSFATALTGNFAYLDYFYIGMIFADDGGRVLEMTGLASASRSGFDFPYEFNKSIVVPDGARYYSFSYRGQAIEGGSSTGGGRSSFFYYPIR